MGPISSSLDSSSSRSRFMMSGVEIGALVAESTGAVVWAVVCHTWVDFRPSSVCISERKDNELSTYSPRLEGPSSLSSSSLASVPNRC